MMVWLAKLIEVFFAGGKSFVSNPFDRADR